MLRTLLCRGAAAWSSSAKYIRVASTSSDKHELKELTLKVVQDLGGAIGVQLLYIGDRLSLFSHLARAGADGMTPAALAAAAGCHPRYVEVWCDAVVSSSYCEK